MPGGQQLCDASRTDTEASLKRLFPRPKQLFCEDGYRMFQIGATDPVWKVLCDVDNDGGTLLRKVNLWQRRIRARMRLNTRQYER